MYLVSCSLGNVYLGDLVARATLLMPGPTSADARPQTVGWVTSAPPLTTDGTSTATPQRTVQQPMQELDYLYRGASLADVPFYFYVAAVSRVAVSRVHEPMLVAPFHCQHPSAGRTVQKVALDEAWAVPHLVGRFIPTKAQDPELRALMLLLLFKPWQSYHLHDLLRPCRGDATSRLASWDAAFSDFFNHLLTLQSSQQARPLPFSLVFWADRVLAITLFRLPA